MTGVGGSIVVRGARTHNLRSIDVDIPHDRLVVFTGVSGSGKSSLVIDTVHTEAQRQLIETFSSFARQRLPKLSRPDVEALEHLTTSILIDQKPMGRNLRSTVGTATELHTYLRLLFARCGNRPGLPSFFLASTAPGRLPAVHGSGGFVSARQDLLVDGTRYMRDGASRLPTEGRRMELARCAVLGMFDVTRRSRTGTRGPRPLLHAEAVPVERRTGRVLHEDGCGRRPPVEAAAAEPRTVSTTRWAWPAAVPHLPGLPASTDRISSRVPRRVARRAAVRQALVRELSDLDCWLTDLPAPLEPPAAIAAPWDQVAAHPGHLIRSGPGTSTHRPVATLSGGRGPAREDGPPAVCVMAGADRRPRRAPCAGLHARTWTAVSRSSSCATGGTRCSGRARSGRHRPRGPRHRDRPGAGPAWRHARVRRPGGRLPRLRDGHGRCARRSPWPAQSSAAPVVGHVGHPRRLRQQPPRHRRRHPEGCPRRGHRRGRLGKSTSSTRSWSRAVRTPSVITCAERADQIPTPISYVGASTGAGAFSRRRRGPRRRCSPSTRPAPARDAAAPSPAGRDELSYDESTTPARTAVARRFRRGPRPRLRAAASRRPGPHGRGGARPSRARTGSSTGWTSPAFGLGYLTLASHSRACPR